MHDKGTSQSHQISLPAPTHVRVIMHCDQVEFETLQKNPAKAPPAFLRRISPRISAVLAIPGLCRRSYWSSHRGNSECCRLEAWLYTESRLPPTVGMILWILHVRALLCSYQAMLRSTEYGVRLGAFLYQSPVRNRAQVPLGFVAG